jgi:HK97 family phage portal protein
MAWNRSESKSLEGQSETKAASIGVGAPISLNPSVTGRGYKDGWDIERAYREGVQKVTWVFRCIDAIAGNQARLPMVLRTGNSPTGEVITNDKEVLPLLNSKSNEGENSFIFRFRLSSQLLMSTRGVFVEKVRGRNGQINALHLLPPQHTSPIPDPKTFVSGYEVLLPGGGRTIIKPDDVIWVRRPHPLNPYLSLTPMETAGVAIEIENLAKIYNRNFLLNDGRPGGLLVVRGEMDEDDKEELRSRFRGNLNRAGQTSVIAADDGVDFVDTSSNPRDAAYVQMRQITKEEILAAFGVPESVIGNASGRTFSNASEEIRVFWMETMQPHLEIISRALDDLDEKRYVDFDTSSVPILIIAKQERERYLMEEFNNGLISGNEYRDGTGRSNIESELMDSLLANPNLTPIGNTEKPFNPEQQQPVDMVGTENAGPPAPTGAEGTPVPPAAPEAAAPAATPTGTQTPAEPTPAQEAALSTGPMRFKDLENKYEPDEWDAKSEQAVDRWTEIMDRSLERLFERQMRVVLEKASGAKARRSIAMGDLKIDQIFDESVWNKQMIEDLRPVVSAIVNDAADLAVETDGKADPQQAQQPVNQEEVQQYLDSQMARMQKVNDTTKQEILAAILVVMLLAGDEDKSGILRTALGAIFASLVGQRRRRIAENETQSAYNAGTYLALQRAAQMAAREEGSTGGEDGRVGRKVTKMWLSERDSKVRPAHAALDGNSVHFDKPFKVDGFDIRFPGDPLAPPHLSIGCRCRLRFGR